MTWEVDSLGREYRKVEDRREWPWIFGHTEFKDGPVIPWMRLHPDYKIGWGHDQERPNSHV